MTIRQRRWNRKNPAPPPTPDGWVYATMQGGRTQLVKAKDFQKACQKAIGHLDELPEPDRLRAKETGIVPDLTYSKTLEKDNKRLAPLGFGRAR